MKIKEFYTFFLSELKPIYGNDEATAITSMIFESLAGYKRSAIVTNQELDIEYGVQQKLEEALLDLKQHKPVQYIIGHAWFCNLSFKVSTAVLVPRPETEELASSVIDFMKTEGKKSLLDIGTGSGCIPICIKNILPHAEVSAMDISEDALLIAKENADVHFTNIKWIKMNFLDETNWEQLPVFDVIVSNPPYIPEKEKEKLDKNVTEFEPHLALFVPDNQPLLFYEKIAAFGKEHLKKDGGIFMEIHENYAKAVADHFSKQGYDTRILKDFYEKERMIMATHCR